MKTLKRLSVLFVAVGAILLSTSCKKVAEKIEDTLGIPSMTCTVSGKKWDAKLPVGNVKDGRLSVFGTAGLKSDAIGQIIVTVESATVGTYDLSDISGVVYKKAETVLEDSDDYYVSSLATIVITKVDKGMVFGTFRATVHSVNNPLDIIQIEHGVFENVIY